ncbi:uncharacterized protein LOC112568992 isoform X2 [Pomacea canaliculata]|uniref:uncharacterized protein LOC112568992 isoform X2 n=1 Tax=Pomacea canaliculata TaxID=400727 RepID=UPI000D73DFBC|nr:uncharacterized protein LOC112568992 isoform X2 [Pomacea canaliculata]
MIEHRCVSAMTLVRPLRPRSLTCTLLVLQLLLESTAQALVFVFPNHSDDVITVPENTEIRIPFGLEGLESLQQSQLIISVYNSTGQSMLKICSIIYYSNNRSYMISDERGICVNHTGPVPLMFRTRVSRWDDKNTLVWQVIGVKDLEKALRLEVTYPATVVSLTFTHEPSANTSIVEEGSTSVQLLCLWVNGNPPSAARLLDRERQVLTQPDHGTTNDNLTYRLTYSPTKINCNSSGVITCEVVGAEVNRSVTLLVRCPPEFQAVNGTPIKFDNRNRSVRIEYRVRAHTNVIEKCEVKKLQSTSQKVLAFLLPKTAFRCLLTGQPPDLMLTVVMDDMNYVIEGAEQLWRLELTNDKGTGSVEFSLPIVDGKESVFSAHSCSMSPEFIQ